MPAPTRRQLLAAGLGAAGMTALAACSAPTSATGPAPARAPFSPSPPTATALSPAPGQRVVTTTVTPAVVTVDLGGVSAKTWAYGGTVPGPLLRATAGDLLRVRVDNRLPTETSVHWHGIRLRNVADGVPGITQPPIAAASTYLYEFVAPDPGTYFFHPHTGVQIDRGLYAPLIVDDPGEPGGYDAEWVVILDDWTDGIGRSPDDILAEFKAQEGTVGTGMHMPGMNRDQPGMGRMTDGGMPGMGRMTDGGMMNSPLGDAGDLAYPHYLINGRVAAAPVVLSGRPGQRVRIRLINAGADTVFAVALGAHQMTVTHSDGYPVRAVDTPALYVAMGERYDVLVRLSDGAFPLVARAVGKTGSALAVVRTGSGAAPTPATPVPELDGRVLLGTTLRAAEPARLPEKEPDRSVDVQLNGQMRPYAWGINGKRFGDDTPLAVAGGQRLRMRMTNMTMMAHPMHIHGHTWSLPGSDGLRKDTVLVAPMQTIEADLEADNPGAWAYHCHNIYHAETGMMTTLRYT